MIPMAGLPNEIVFLRQSPHNQIFVALIGKNLPHVLQTKPSFVHSREEVRWILPRLHDRVQKMLAACTTGLLDLGVECAERAAQAATPWPREPCTEVLSCTRMVVYADPSVAKYKIEKR